METQEEGGLTQVAWGGSPSLWECFGERSGWLEEQRGWKHTSMSSFRCPLLIPVTYREEFPDPVRQGRMAGETGEDRWVLRHWHGLKCRVILKHQERLHSSVRGSGEKEQALAARHLKKSRTSLDPAGATWLTALQKLHNSHGPQDKCKMTRNPAPYNKALAHTGRPCLTGFHERYGVIMKQMDHTGALLAIKFARQLDRPHRQTCYVTKPPGCLLQNSDVHFALGNLLPVGNKILKLFIASPTVQPIKRKTQNMWALVSWRWFNFCKTMSPNLACWWHCWKCSFKDHVYLRGFFKFC